MRLTVAQWKFTRPSASFQSSTHFAKQTCEFREPHPNRHKMGPINTEHRFDLGLAQASIWQAYTKTIKTKFFLNTYFLAVLFFLRTAWHIAILALKDLCWCRGEQIRSLYSGNAMLGRAHLTNPLAMLGLCWTYVGPIWQLTTFSKA